IRYMAGGMMTEMMAHSPYDGRMMSKHVNAVYTDDYRYYEVNNYDAKSRMVRHEVADDKPFLTPSDEPSGVGYARADYRYDENDRLIEEKVSPIRSQEPVMETHI